MTESPERNRCRWCGRGIDPRPGPGRPREFCKPSCRQADYVARLRRTEVGLSEHELIVTREALEDLRDKIYVLEAAIEDVDRGDDDPQEALQWLLEAARPVVGRTLMGDAAAADGSVPPIMSVMSDPPEVSR